jgi:uncharacterized membrane-anchored protein YjiN (DUF445 family)
MKNPEHPMRIKLKDYVIKKILDLKFNSELQQKLEAWKQDKLNHMVKIQDLVSTFIKHNQNQSQEVSSSFSKLINELNEQVDKFINKFSENADWQLMCDSKVKHQLLHFVDDNHSLISIMVKENLSKYSNKMLVNLIETKVGNDLQMIRINGSVVGGLVGMAVFVLTFWI